MSAWTDLSQSDRRLMAEAAQRLINEPTFRFAIQVARENAVEAYLKLPATSDDNVLVEARAKVLAIDAAVANLRNFVNGLVGMPKQE